LIEEILEHDYSSTTVLVVVMCYFYFEIFMLISYRTTNYIFHHIFLLVYGQETQLNPFLRLMGMPKIVYTEFDIDDDDGDGDIEKKS
jgi:hypothetical protein